MENDFLIKTLNKYYKKEDLEKILKGLSMKKKSSFRINRLKSNESEIESELNKNNISFKKLVDLKDIIFKDFDENIKNFILENLYDTYIVEDEEEIRKLSLYEEGKIYFQNISAMIPPVFLDLKEGDNILDMCSAPGGKTCEIQSLMNNKINLTAYELNKIRFEKLKYNIDLQGANVLLQNKDARVIDDFFKFDKILLDAPCTGLGTINLSSENYKKYFTKELIDKSIKNQKTLLNKALKILKKGGTLVYSTCSILSCENEEIVKDLKNIYGDFLEIKILPNEYLEGFYIFKIIL